MRTLNARTAVATALIAPLLAACGNTSGNGGEPAEPVDGTDVAIVDNAYEPQALRVETGQEVVWTWKGNNPHDVLFDQASSDIQQDGTWTRTFDQAGEYTYHCSVHPDMAGTIVAVSS